MAPTIYATSISAMRPSICRLTLAAASLALTPMAQALEPTASVPVSAHVPTTPLSSLPASSPKSPAAVSAGHQASYPVDNRQEEILSDQPSPAHTHHKKKAAKTTPPPTDPMQDLEFACGEALESVRARHHEHDPSDHPETDDERMTALRAAHAHAHRVRTSEMGSSRSISELGATTSTTSTTPLSGTASSRWSYADPQRWAALTPEFAQCASGKRQSPIDIRDGIHVNIDAITVHYQSSAFRMLDNGHMIQALIEPGNYIELGGKRYDLQRIDFHAPSEERINGIAYAMDAQLYHRDAQGHWVAIAVLLKSGTEHPVIQRLWDNLPLEQNEEQRSARPVDLTALIPGPGAYYTYMGSLTTPPCTEGVLWLVMKHPLDVSDYQLAIFKHLYSMNARPPQAAQGRLIKESN